MTSGLPRYAPSAMTARPASLVFDAARAVHDGVVAVARLRITECDYQPGVGVDRNLKIGAVAVVLRPGRHGVVAGRDERSVHNGHLIDPAAPYRAQREQRAEGVDNPVRGRGGDPEQRTDLAHRQVRPPVHGDQQPPIRQVQRPLPPRPTISNLVPATGGDQAHQTAELRRSQPGERMDQLRPRRRDYLPPGILNDHYPRPTPGLRDDP